MEAVTGGRVAKKREGDVDLGAVRCFGWSLEACVVGGVHHQEKRMKEAKREEGRDDIELDYCLIREFWGGWVRGDD